MSEENRVLDFSESRLPYSVEAEQAVLGSVIIEPKSYLEIASLMKPEFFYIPQHRTIFGILTEMFELNQSIDLVSLLERLKKSGEYDETGGKAYLTQLVQSVPSAANVLTYVAIIRERYYARALMNAAQEILREIDENVMDSTALLEAAEQKIYEIRDGRDVEGLMHIASVIQNETYDRLLKMSNPETRGDYVGIPSGIGALDKMITGLNKSDLIILGARPGMGKTSFALNIARNVAVNAGKTVCFFSLEMSRDQLAQRLLSGEAMVDGKKLRTGELETDEWTRLAQAGDTLSKANIFLDETATITVPQMKAKLMRMKKRADLVVVDYLGLMKNTHRTENRAQEVQEITRALKIMAKDLKIPVIVCAQLNRGTEAKGKSHMPALADLRESGSIEQDADIVLFLYREKYYDNEKSEEEDRSDPGAAKCIVAKNRHGESGVIDLHFDERTTHFTSVEFTR